ncbi:hypothetical protein BVSY1_09830 [Bacillus velezensis]|nr:hypothetical protein BVSY1_09830 [Bacillus velezensis]
MNKSTFEVFTKGGNVMAVNDTVEILSSSSEHLNGQTGVITGILAGDYGTEVKVLLSSGIETWIDAEEVLSF